MIVNGTLGREPHIYCLERVGGILPRLRNVWTKFKVSLVVSKAGNLTLQPGNSSAAIRQVSHGTFWTELWVESNDEKLTQVEFSPFEGGCVGVASLKGNQAHEYQVVFRQGECTHVQQHCWFLQNLLYSFFSQSLLFFICCS